MSLVERERLWILLNRWQDASVFYFGLFGFTETSRCEFLCRQTNAFGGRLKDVPLASIGNDILQ